MNWLHHLAEFWPHLAAGFSFLASLIASIHAVLNKRDSRAAALWLGFIWLLPLLGPVLYLALGVNRNRRQALVNGDEAYPAMLNAIEQANVSVSLATYIFGNDRSGRRFVEALGRA